MSVCVCACASNDCLNILLLKFELFSSSVCFLSCFPIKDSVIFVLLLSFENFIRISVLSYSGSVVIRRESFSSAFIALRSLHLASANIRCLCCWCECCADSAVQIVLVLVLVLVMLSLDAKQYEAIVIFVELIISFLFSVKLQGLEALDACCKKTRCKVKISSSRTFQTIIRR